MAQPNLDFFKKRNILAKAEVTEGTDSVPVGATDGFRLFEGSSSTEFDKVERMLDRAHFGGDQFSVANKRAKIEGEFELYPPLTPGAASTSDADCARMLLPGGMSVVKDLPSKTTIYNPISSNIPTITAYWYHVRRLLKVLGARAEISGVAIEIGQRFKAKVSLTGDYVDVSTSALPTVTLPTKIPVVATARNMRTKIGTLIRGATAATDLTPLVDLLVWAKTLSVDFGSSLAHKEYSSKSVNQISERKPTFMLRIATTDLADFNPWYVRDNNIPFIADASLFEVEGATPATVLVGLYSKIAIRGQIENITAADIDGDDGWEITGPCIPTDAGGDEFLIEFGDNTP